MPLVERQACAQDLRLIVLAKTLEATRAFAGNEGIEVLYDVTDPAHVVVIERWSSLAHDDAYRAWRATPE